MRFINIDHRYGGHEEATVANYQELTPEGSFEARFDGVYENLAGDWQLIALPFDFDDGEDKK